MNVASSALISALKWARAVGGHHVTLPSKRRVNRYGSPVHGLVVSSVSRSSTMTSRVLAAAASSTWRGDEAERGEPEGCAE